MFDEEIINSLSENPVSAGRKLIAEYKKFDERPGSTQSRIDNYDNYLVIYATFVAFYESYWMNSPKIKIDGDKLSDINKIRAFVNEIDSKLSSDLASQTLERAKQQFLVKFDRVTVYRFSDGDIKKIQSLINELRDEISNSSYFDENHRDRLLSKLEKLQKDLYKKMSNLDKFWGLIGDAGVVLGKFGRDAKPITDRIKDIMQIVWRAQSIFEELPSDSPLPMLEDLDDQDDQED